MNKELYNKQYRIPLNIINYINSVLYSHPSGIGVRRGKYIVKNGTLTYQALKGLKHDFSLINTNTPEGKLQYDMSGGNLMKNFVDSTLNRDRAGVKIGNEVRQDVTNNITSDLGITKVHGLNEEHKIIKENAIAVIVNKNNNILLLKRSDGDFWGAGKFGLVGGGIEIGETPENACRREIFEETGLILNKFNERYTITRNGETEYIFAVRYDDSDDTKIKLNNEHTTYGWFSIDEIKYLDTVPQLMEYLILCFKKY